MTRKNNINYKLEPGDGCLHVNNFLLVNTWIWYQKSYQYYQLKHFLSEYLSLSFYPHPHFYLQSSSHSCPSTFISVPSHLSILCLPLFLFAIHSLYQYYQLEPNILFTFTFLCLFYFIPISTFIKPFLFSSVIIFTFRSEERV